MLKNTLSSYGLITKLFHWFIGIAIVGLLVIGFIMVSMLPSADKWQLYSMHKATGVLVLFLVSLRVLWRLVNVKLELPADLPLWQKLASKITHYLLYIFMFLMPVSGILMSRFGGHEINVFNLFIFRLYSSVIRFTLLLYVILALFIKIFFANCCISKLT